MSPKTHLAISPSLVGTPLELSQDRASAQLLTTAAMAADSQGLVHGGFVFGLVDYAAMLAVNDPKVVLGSAELRFLAPVRVGDLVQAWAEVSARTGRKRVLQVRAQVGAVVVVQGTVTALVLERHVLG